MSKVLLAITSYNQPFYEDGAKTGLFASEAIHPFEAFKAKGFDVDFVSETGEFGYDEHSLAENFLDGDIKDIYENKKSEYNINLKQLKKASDINPAEYGIFFAAGGHGTCFDFPEAKGLVKAAESIYAQGGVVSAVCHGPLIFNSMKDPKTGKPLIENKTVTGFTDEGEKEMKLETIIASQKLLTVESMSKDLGANYKGPQGNWDDFSLSDGRIVTGVNPFSAISTAQKAILALNNN